MSHRFFRCPDCGLPHDASQTLCPLAGHAALRGNSLPPRLAPIRAPPWPPPERGLVGKTIGGKYMVCRVLGSGGMGTVYEAEHIAIGRRVAIKVLHAVQARGKEAALRFYREARAAGCIGHPNVCEVYDLDTLDDGRPYLVMEKLAGDTLGGRIAAKGKLPPRDIVHILVQVLSALIAAHAKGIVHRDIKPENVFLVERSGCSPLAKLLDFGVSKATAARVGSSDSEVDLTRRGMVMGTPNYLSPEQARGDRDLDTRVDLYACGVILYEGLTGQRPFVAPNHADLLHAILRATPRPASDLRRALPSAFDAVIAKAMARNRDDRYATAEQFQRDLRSLRDGSAETIRLGANVLRSGPSPSPAGPGGDEQPTQIWSGRLPPVRADGGAQRPRPWPFDSSDDHDTVIRPRLSERLARAERGRAGRT